MARRYLGEAGGEQFMGLATQRFTRWARITIRPERSGSSTPDGPAQCLDGAERLPLAGAGHEAPEPTAASGGWGS